MCKHCTLLKTNKNFEFIFFAEYISGRIKWARLTLWSPWKYLQSSPRYWTIQSRERVLKAKTFKEMSDREGSKLEFPEGRGTQTKNWGGGGLKPKTLRIWILFLKKKIHFKRWLWKLKTARDINLSLILFSKEVALFLFQKHLIT